jgi:hypothetical protein
MRASDVLLGNSGAVGPFLEERRSRGADPSHVGSTLAVALDAARVMCNL